MIPKSHPRYKSLVEREKIIQGLKDGIVAEAGLIAHGRGECFDYLIGEKSEDFAIVAEKAAVARIMLAKNPVFSVNGNVAALAPQEVATLSSFLQMKIEVNLFYRSEERVKKIVEKFREYNVEILGENPDARIPRLEHNRALCTKEGIYTADVVLVALEDGDRTEALKKMGKFVIAIDLNPLSRTAQKADITIVDELTRALKNMIKFSKDIERKEAEEIIHQFSNNEVLKESLIHIKNRLENLAHSSFSNSSGLKT